MLTKAVQIFKSLDIHLQEIIHGTSVAFMFRCVGALLALASQIVLVRVLGAEDAGRYVLSVSCVLFMTVLGQMGLGPVLVRGIAAHDSVHEYRSVFSLQRAALQIALPASLAFATALFLSAGVVSNLVFKDPSIKIILQIMAFATPFWTIATLYSEMLRGLKKVGQYLFVQSIIMPVIVLSGLLFFNTKLGLIGQAFVYVIASFLAALIAMVLWGRSVKKCLTKGIKTLPFSLLKSGLPLLWVACALYMNNWISTVILGVYGGAVDVALYNSASRLALAPGFLLISVSSILGPKISAIYKKGNYQELQSVTVQAARILLLIVVPIFICFFTFPGVFLNLFGSEFKAIALDLRVLAFGQMSVFLTGFAGQILIMTGHEKDLRNITTVTVLFNLIISCVLIMYYKTIGAAWASALSTIFTSFLGVAYVKKRLGLWSHVFSKIII